jgi:hypothetical protein
MPPQVRDYLIGRNVRLLSTIAAQLERTIESDRDVLTNLRLEFEKDDQASSRNSLASGLCVTHITPRGSP